MIENYEKKKLLELLASVAREQASALIKGVALHEKDEAKLLEVLECRLLSLLEAGQALANMPDDRYFNECSDAWNAALERQRAQKHE